MIWFFRMFPICIAGIFAYNYWDDPERTLSEDVGLLLLMICGAALLYVFSRLIFRFVLVWSEHEQQRK